MNKSQIKAKAIARAKSASRILTGDAELDAKLSRLKKTGTANRIARSGMAAQLRVLVKGIKAQVPSTLKDAKRTVSSVFDRKGKGFTVRAKAGFGVGKGFKAAPKSRSGRSGVGISGRNIVWFAMGTGPRATKTVDKLGRQPHSTGRMAPDPKLQAAVKAAVAAKKSEMQKSLRDKCLAALAREAAK